MAQVDGRPARKATYLKPLTLLVRRCADRSLDDVRGAVVSLVGELRDLPGVTAPAASAESVLVAAAHRGTDCAKLAATIGREVTGRAHITGSTFLRTARFSPSLTAELALSTIRHSLHFGKVRVVYSLKAYSCQQEIFMGPSIARQYGNPDLGAFVELTSGKGVGHGKYDARRVNRARITPFGRIGGQPCRS